MCCDVSVWAESHCGQRYNDPLFWPGIPGSQSRRPNKNNIVLLWLGFIELSSLRFAAGHRYRPDRRTNIDSRQSGFSTPSQCEPLLPYLQSNSEVLSICGSFGNPAWLCQDLSDCVTWQLAGNIWATPSLPRHNIVRHNTAIAQYNRGWSVRSNSIFRSVFFLVFFLLGLIVKVQTELTN